MQQIADVADRSWLYSWQGTIQVAEDQLDTAVTYEMMTGMSRDEDMEV